MNKPIEDLIEQVSKELRPRYNSSSLKKHKFMCPACKALKFNTEVQLRDHLFRKHKNMVELGLDVLPNGHFKASPLFLINVLLLIKSKPQLYRTIMKNAMMFDIDY